MLIAGVVIGFLLAIAVFSGSSRPRYFIPFSGMPDVGPPKKKRTHELEDTH